MNIQNLKKQLNDNEFKEFNTLHMILANAQITTKDLVLLKAKHNKTYEQLKALFAQKIADLYELAINRPRQIQSMMKLIEAQENYFSRLFPDENTNTINMPNIIITPSNDKSPTRLSIDTIIATKD